MFVTLNEVEYPFGKKSMVNNKASVMSGYEEKFASIQDTVEVNIFKEINSYIFQMNFRSSDEDLDIFYTVIFEFTPMIGKKSNNLRDYKLSVFSNSPSFVYGFTYAYNSKNALIRRLNNKYSNKSKRTKALQTNPHNFLGYEKSVVFMLKYIKDNNLIEIDNINNQLTKRRFEPSKIYSQEYILDAIKESKEAKRDKKEIGKSVEGKDGWKTKVASIKNKSFAPKIPKIGNNLKNTKPQKLGKRG